MVSRGYNKRINGSWLESTNTRRCFCCLVILACLPLLVLTPEVFGQKENTRPELKCNLRQKLNPAPPTAIRIGPKTELPGGPVARIAPKNLKVKQGDPAVFRNVSLFDPDVPLARLFWIGPDKVRKQTDPFEVQTGNLQPGNYQIILEVFDKRNRSSNAKATLEVLALPPKRGEKPPLKDLRIIPPEVIGSVKDPIPTPERPVARIQPDRLRVVQGERVVFRSESTPAGRVRGRWGRNRNG